jgi:hypothetical protein
MLRNETATEEKKMNTKIKSFDRTTLKAMRPEIEAALKLLEDQFGISVTLGSARFTNSTATFKFDLAVICENGDVENKERSAFKAYAFMYGLKPEMLDQQFEYQGKMFTIIGLNTKAKTMPVQVKRADSKQFKISVDTINRYFKAV